MGPVDKNFYFDPTNRMAPGQDKRITPVRPDEETAKLIREKMEKKGLVTLMTGPDAARLDKKEETKKKDEIKKEEKNPKKKGDDKNDLDSSIK